MLGDGWHTVGFWLAHCWFMVGRMLHYGWRFMLGQRVSNEQSNVGPTKYVAVGPTLNQRLGFGWRMVIVLAGFVGTMLVNHLMYADDVVLLSPSAAGLSLLLSICSTYGIEYDVMYNSTKSNVLIFRSKLLKMCMYLNLR